MKSKHFFIVPVLLCFLTSCQSSLRISGTSPSDNPITINHSVGDEQQTVATINPINGKFSHKVKLLDTTEAYLLLTDLKQTIGRFFIAEKGHIHITIDTTGDVRVTGTKLNNRLQKYHDQRNSLFTSFKEVYFPHQEKRAKGKEASQAESEQLRKEAILLDSLEKKIIDLDIQFIAENINNAAGQLTLNNLVLHSPTVEQLKEIINAANEETQKTKSLQRVADHISNVEQTSLGKSFTDIELEYPNGETVHIADLLKKGEDVLLYIYVPSYFIAYDALLLNDLYSQCKNNSIEPIAVAIDESKNSWLNILDRYDMQWTQLIDTSGIDGNLATSYGLSTFPHFILLGEDGVISLRSSNINELKNILKDNP